MSLKNKIFLYIRNRLIEIVVYSFNVKCDVKHKISIDSKDKYFKSISTGHKYKFNHINDFQEVSFVKDKTSH